MSLNTNIEVEGFTGLNNFGDFNNENNNGISNKFGLGVGVNSLNGYNPTIFTQNYFLNQLQSILQLELFKKFTYSNFFVDIASKILITTFTSSILNKTKTVSDNTDSAISWVYNKFVYGIKWSYGKLLNTPVKKIKHVEIPYISDNRKINELYKAVSWYLSTNSEIDYTKETDLQYVYEKPIVPENFNFIKSNMGLNKIMSQNKSKEIKFKNYIIKYELNTELVTIYTDREKKRENYKVKLWVEIDQFVNYDILEEFCQLCITEYMKSLTSNNWKQQIYINKDGRWEGEPSNNTRKLETIILQNSLKDEIKDDLQRFINSEDWYNSLDIPFNRGYLFYGKPGTGKTSLIRGLSLHFKRHIHFVMLQNIKSDVELLKLFGSINYKETILVIEDIDAMVSAVKSRESKLNELDKEKSDSESDTDLDPDDKSKINKKLRKELKKLKKQNKDLIENKDFDIPGYKKREPVFGSNSNSINTNSNKATDSGITLSGLLNALDGVVSSPGRILIMTTNHPEVLDDALVRPGRCDAKFQFDFCNKSQIKELYQMFFGIEAPTHQLANIKASEYSPAHITAVFLRHRNEPVQALEHLDDIEQKIVIKPLVEVSENSNTQNDIQEITPNNNYLKQDKAVTVIQMN